MDGERQSFAPASDRFDEGVWGQDNNLNILSFTTKLRNLRHD
jgi:hypothetical protein